MFYATYNAPYLDPLAEAVTIVSDGDMGIEVPMLRCSVLVGGYCESLSMHM